MNEDSQLNLGGLYTRDDLAEIFGGWRMRGIARAKKGPFVLLWADPATGKAHGYFDSLDAEEDELGPLAHYSGEGQPQQGAQKLSAGNNAIFKHRDEGRELLLFWAVGKTPGRDQKIHQYVGKFEIDATRPYFVRSDGSGDKERNVFVFRLRPIGQISRPPVDYMPVTIETTYVETHPGPILDSPSEASSRLIELEQNSGAAVLRRATPEAVVERREGGLVDRFEAFLEAQQHLAKRWLVSPGGLRSSFQTDLFDVTANVLYEAKGKADRNSVRMAIGQLFDYRRSIAPSPQLAILLPQAPDGDLQDLITSLGISLVYEDDGDFIGWPVVKATTP